ncbi:probable RNA-dependent RNA polymerase 5 isoform X2 [Rhododendron vialii]|uniref:probable RNA-dependent RNA polymerase 5 isoform X2 n=1 Tax=Rhododendron vialii TaxID=182163 RepID=UPI00265E4E41|nr:probable RNA-dependent RNA polymerase 5 isoform X2 [Rhododendron vialii]
MSSLSPSSTLTGPLLPPSVEQMIQRICAEQCQTPPDGAVRWQLDQLGEEASLDILRKFSTQSVRKSLSADIVFMAKNARSRGTGNLSPSKRSAVSISPSPVGSPNGFSPHSPIAKRALLAPSTNLGTASIGENNPLMALYDLEFRKAFLILSYAGRRKLEELITVDHIMMLKDLPMRDFETEVWDAVGKNNINKEDRIQYLDWDSRKTHLYHCHVHQDGSYAFKGPYLGNTRTHLQRKLGDDNVLIVKFVEEASECTNKMVGSSYYDAVLNTMAKQGILIGLRRYRFFVFKDGGKEEKKKNQTSSSVKCIFVRFESLAPCEEREPYILANKSVYEARSLFMHANMVPTMAKYMARFSLILSTTIKLQVDLASVTIERIEDTPCRDENECIVRDEEGERLIHTDGTGFISEDLALKIPKDFSRAKYIKDGNFERFLDHVNCEEKSPELEGSEAHTREPPLLMQVRLFRNGLAVKGTLLLNKKLQNTIQIRPSMIKVEPDPRLINAQSFNSLEIVAVSHKPKRAFLSKNLIALLSYGGVPEEFFLKILENELKDTGSAYSETRAALRAALNHGERDDDFTLARMILSGVPLNEPYLQYRLCDLAKDERKALKGGKLPVTESFYLMGTTDPTGKLKSHQVCVILDNGQISGELLVYRNPGLHFGDIHRLEAVYVKELEETVGNAKYAIFFSTKGERSVANEIANGDFDGDTYWISRNPELLESFKVSEPWRRIYSTPSVRSKMPNELSEEELEHELFKLFKKTRFQQSNSMGVAADSWTAFMDRLLILGDSCAEETERMKVTMHQLVDTYYDALDAPKSGKKVVIPDELKAEKFPHYMGRANSYHSTSVLGLIYDTVEKFLQSEDLPANDVEILKLPFFDVPLSKDSWMLWGKRYEDYRNEMSAAVKLEDEDAKNVAANAVTNNFKQLLYRAPEFEESKRDVEEIYRDALAIYNVVYEYAEKVGDIGRCRFAWKVAGPALLKLYLLKNTETEKVKNPFLCSPTVLQKLFK